MTTEFATFQGPERLLFSDLERQPKPPTHSERTFEHIHDKQNEIASHHDHHDDTSFRSLLAGGVGGTLEVMTDHPIDLVKVRMQTATSASLIAGTKQPKHFLPILSHVVQNEGISGLWQGASVRVASHMPATAVSFWGYDWGKKLVRLYKDQKSQNHVSKAHRGEQKLSIRELIMAGAFSGIPVTLFETPLERIKCLLQTQSRAATVLYQGPVDCGVQLFQQSGFAGLYRGVGITAARNIPGFGVWFGTYELLKEQMNKNSVFGDSASSSWLSIIMSGGFAGSASWCVMMPFDAIKSVIQTSPNPLSIRQAYRQVTAKSHMALYRGVGPTVLIAFPANAACFLGAEIAWKAMSALE